jgi:hypothetical protein
MRAAHISDIYFVVVHIFLHCVISGLLAKMENEKRMTNCFNVIKYPLFLCSIGQAFKV